MSNDSEQPKEPYIPLRSLYDKGDNAQTLFERGLADYNFSMQAFFDKCVDKCESPIERLLLAALCTRMRMEFTFFLSHPSEDWLGNLKNAVICSPQIKIGPYRADFVLYDLRHTPVKRTVIECDGHDFHERTKEQARRDRSRDRWFAAQGIAVLRFTGSEIYQDPFLVADEIARWIARS